MYLSMKSLNFVKGTGGSPTGSNVTEVWSWPLTSISYNSYKTSGFT